MRIKPPLQPVSPRNVSIRGGFWGPRVDTNRQATLPVEYHQLKRSGRLHAANWKPGRPRRPHRFWNSDVAKWIEACAYVLMNERSPALERTIDDYISRLTRMQLSDGYVNDHYCLIEPDKRWTNLRDHHELYCAGHLIEAGVAYYEATGKRRLLDAIVRCADHIDNTFGREHAKRRGYPGHEEIELALVKLADATDDKKYLRLARYFVDERGRTPHYFDTEAQGRGEAPRGAQAYDYHQAHVPVVEQKDAVGHAVRALYLYCGMADVAANVGDRQLLQACRRLWRSITERRMYVTGGVGDTRNGERFTFDYDLPNDSAYAETCAAIALVFFGQRMGNIERDRRYADVMERALYNGVLSGVSLDGRRFFYENPLAALPAATRAYGWNHRAGAVARHEWFGCACCPPNIARLLASLGSYAYSQGPTEARVHLFVNGTVRFDLAGQAVVLTQRTAYPWEESVEMTVTPERTARFAIALRLPGWCREPAMRINGAPVCLEKITRRGYAVVNRTWQSGDRITLRLPMPIERIEAHPVVRGNCGRIALQRGPVVYCLEEADNGGNLHDVVVPRDARLKSRYMKHLLGGCTVVEGIAWRRKLQPWRAHLYHPGQSGTERIRFRAVPYALWCNRKPGEMVVWVRSC
ncbi:MAG: glycoside hydrolase family 127 protein [Chitinivibrionales bacterium]|nr:glycoside hydrolase family 127 protein [Chitinivibrionales bacterium]